MKFKRLLLIGLSVVVLATVLTGCGKKNEETKNYEKENDLGNVAVDNEQNKAKIKEIIKAEIEKKEFLAKNDIKESEINTFEYRIVEDGNDIIYIVSVAYNPENQQSNSKAFQVTYKDGNVSFDVIQEHKYMSEKAEYASNYKILRLSAVYRETTRSNYYGLNNGKFYEITDDVSPAEYNFVELTATSVEYNKKSSQTETQSNTQTKAVAAFSKSDADLNNGVGLGAETDYCVGKLGNDFSSRSYTEDATGDKIVELTFKSKDVVLYAISGTEDAIVRRISVNGNSTVKTARGIGIGSSKQDILNAYPSNSILKNDSESVTVGYPGDDPVYNVNNKVKIFFQLDKSTQKVTGIGISYGHEN